MANLADAWTLPHPSGSFPWVTALLVGEKKAGGVPHPLSLGVITAFSP